MHLRPFLAAATVAALSAPAFAEGPSLIPRPVAAGERLLAGGLPRTLDGRLAFAYRVARNEGRPAKGEHWLLGRSVDHQGLQVTVRFDEEVGEGEAAGLGRAGCVPSRLESGALANVGAVITARCRWEGLWSAAELPGVRFVSPTFGYRLVRPAVPPADTTNREVEADALSAAFYPAGGGGKGVTVCDMDSGVDPFHPFFFRADGGAFAWIDVNGNGLFDPGTDAVDLNRNGQKDPDEVLRTVKSTMRWMDWYSGATTLFNQESAFLPGYDWLYQDENADGVRNAGRTAPFGDAKPTFGEQLYLADDVNRDGRLGVGERVLRLLTPKLKAVRTPATPNGPAQVYRRGVNLAQTPEPSPGDYEHGSMVLGTIGGGVQNLTRFLGIAPEADLMLASTDSASLVNDLAWARGEGAKVVLWEMATWYNEYLDGSSGLEAACDAASDQGVLQVGAAGNLGGSQKHRVATHAPGTQSVPLVIPPGKARYILGDFLWRGQAGGNFTFTLNLNGVAVPLSGSSGQTDAGGVLVQWQRTQSTRQTHMLLFYLVVQSGTIAGQTATFDAVNSGSAAALHGYVTDSYTAWSKGVHWPTTTGATDRGTYGTPGVGDKTLSVATYFASLLPTGAPAGELAIYSGQGPRLDGADTVDFASPEDHVTAYVAAGAGFGEMWVGGGTSNASPVAVGVAAILKGVTPAATSGELIAQLRSHAQVEPGMGTVPNDVWGYGKIRGYRAKFTGVLPPVNAPPIASGRVERIDASNLRVDASASSDPEGQALSYRWDLDYDGTFDLETTTPIQTSALPAPQVSWAKLEVVDARGAIAQVVMQVLDPGADGGGGGGGSDGGQPDGGGGGGGGSGGSGGQMKIIPRTPAQLGAAPGCGCAGSGGPPALWAGLLLLLRWRRRAGA